MNPAADELLRLRQLERESPSSSPLIAVIRRSRQEDLIAQAEAAGGELLLELGGWGWRIGVSTEARLNEREAAERAAFQKRMAAARARRRRRRA